MISLPIEHWLGGEAAAKGAGRGKTTLLGLTLVRLYELVYEVHHRWELQ